MSPVQFRPSPPSKTYETSRLWQKCRPAGFFVFPPISPMFATNNNNITTTYRLCGWRAGRLGKSGAITTTVFPGWHFMAVGFGGGRTKGTPHGAAAAGLGLGCCCYVVVIPARRWGSAGASPGPRLPAVGTGRVAGRSPAWGWGRLLSPGPCPWATRLGFAGIIRYGIASNGGGGVGGQRQARLRRRGYPGKTGCRESGPY